MRTRLIALIGALTVVAVVATGCGGIQSVPLPGGVDTGSNPRTYLIKFDDVLDLVPQSTVKRDGVTVGRIVDISIPKDQWQAIVKIEVRNNVDLSNQAHAAIQQTALLGEKFVGLSEPAGSAGSPRQDESVPISGLDDKGQPRTRTATDIEQVLGALSMLLNGGGLNQLEPIVRELNKAMGHTNSYGGDDNGKNSLKSLIGNADRLIANLNKQRDDIVSAIDGLDKLSGRAANQKAQISRILEQLPAAVAVLEEQRPQFVDLLTKLDKLGQVGVDVLGKSRDAIIADLKALRPILSSLTKSAPDLITAAPLMLTVPFPDWLTPAAHGDSVNLFMTLDLRLLNQLEALGVGQGNPVYSPPKSKDIPVNGNNPYYKGNGPRWGWPTISLLPPAPNSRPGPNTPPSGGRYPAAAKKKQQYSLLPPPIPGQTYLDGPLAMIGASR
ncbi:Mce family protein [Gordonia effusa NBRC 100432]|uniref:Mce family protein n=1 Tax=Gordonia effusa NBRC 100432 TaxID=1077974 RepID=H0R5E2_9ACTN|nr:MCE family protein [Gordonia effusa]GAB20293.1 Mce family protein [Gordonia effusa NBRC 100432]